MKICIVGGGTAGWLAAYILSSERPNNAYTVIESSAIGIIGVGEGTTGFFGGVLERYKLPMVDFMKRTNALPKLGIRFRNWTGDDTQFDASLRGSFSSNEGFPIDSAMYAAIYNGDSIDVAQSQSLLTSKNVTNLCVNERGGFNSYYPNSQAYHFDANEVGKYFKRNCGSKVDTIDATVTGVDHADGKIKSVWLDNGAVVDADIFIDCSGFARLLSNALGIQTKSYQDILPVDRALLFRLKDDPMEKTPCTTAWARDAGWIFEIPTRKKIGRGYVYCSQFTDDETAVKELEAAYSTEVIHDRTIKFTSCRLENSASGNLLSLGLASCFFEPLQATSIHNTIVQIYEYINGVLTDDLEQSTNYEVIKSYNDRINRLYDDTASFLALHYEGGREDSDFWKYVKFDKKKDEKASRILNLAKTRLTRNGDFDVYFGSAGYPLWNLILGGMGHFDRGVIKQQMDMWKFPLDRELKALREQAKRHARDAGALRLLTQKQIDSYLQAL